MLYQAPFCLVSLRVTKVVLTWLFLVGLYQECPNYSPGVKFGLPRDSQVLHGLIVEKTLEISIYLAIRPRFTKLRM